MGSGLANFEGLIRGAIAAKQALTPEARQEVYQSSRNALSRLIETNRDITVESAMHEQKALEEAIIRIETELNRVALANTPVPEIPSTPPEPVSVPDPEPSIEVSTTVAEPIQPTIQERVAPQPEVSPSVEPEVSIAPEELIPAEQPTDEAPPNAAVEALNPEPDLSEPSETHKETETVPEVPSPFDEDDPLAELKEILLEGADDKVRESLLPETSDPVEAVEAVGESDAARLDAAVPVVDGPEVETEIQNQPEVSVDALVEDVAPQVGEVGSATATDEASTPEPLIEAQDIEDKENMPLEFARRRKKQKFLGWFFFTLLVLALLGWLAYYIYLGVINGTLFGQGSPPQNPNAPENQAAAADYITIVEPGDLSALITANRGQAEIVNELNLEMVRLVSVRNDANRSEAAKPILLRLKPGVLEQISGKNVTFEIYAKSASPSPAQFTVKCEFGALGSCGRKRFRVGLQPEASIFAFDLKVVTNPDVQAFIAISTDTTAAASATGRGDVIDLVYARLRANN